MILKKHILPPAFRQLVAHASAYGREQIFPALTLLLPLAFGVTVSAPYCKIVIRQKPPSPFVENIKANLVSNLIWVIIVFLLGFVASVVTQQFLKK